MPVPDAFGRRIVGWSIDARQDTDLVVIALDMAIRNRRPEPGGVDHAHHGLQFTPWTFGNKIGLAGLTPSFGSVGDGLDNAMMESFCSSMQPAVCHRHHRASSTRRTNLLLRHLGHLLAPSCRVVNQLLTHGGAGDERSGMAIDSRFGEGINLGTIIHFDPRSREWSVSALRGRQAEQIDVTARVTRRRDVSTKTSVRWRRH